MSLLYAELIDTVSFVSISSKFTVPPALRSWALASTSSVKFAKAASR